VTWPELQAVAALAVVVGDRRGELHVRRRRRQRLKHVSGLLAGIAALDRDLPSAPLRGRPVASPGTGDRVHGDDARAA
jgi:hypothetical protein